MDNFFELLVRSVRSVTNGESTNNQEGSGEPHGHSSLDEPPLRMLPISNLGIPKLPPRSRMSSGLMFPTMLTIVSSLGSTEMLHRPENCPPSTATHTSALSWLFLL